MPKKKDLPWEVKLVIWDAAVTNNTFEAAKRTLEGRFKELAAKDIYFDEPDENTIRKIVKIDINALTPEVVIAKLPRHIWSLRNDYEEILKLHKSILGESKPVDTIYMKARDEHLSAILRLLKRVAEQEWGNYESLSDILLGDITKGEHDELFPMLLQHCPSIRDKYEKAKMLKSKLPTIHLDDYVDEHSASVQSYFGGKYDIKRAAKTCLSNFDLSSTCDYCPKPQQL